MVVMSVSSAERPMLAWYVTPSHTSLAACEQRRLDFSCNRLRLAAGMVAKDLFLARMLSLRLPSTTARLLGVNPMDVFTWQKHKTKMHIQVDWRTAC
jgi:hypothetical protein